MPQLPAHAPTPILAQFDALDGAALNRPAISPRHRLLRRAS